MKGAPSRPRLQASGDSLLLVELEAGMDPVVNARAVALAEALRAARLPGVRDVVPSYASRRRARRSAAPRRCGARARRRRGLGRRTARDRGDRPADRDSRLLRRRPRPRPRRGRGVRPLHARRRRAPPQRRGLPRLHARLPARLRLSRRGRRGDRDAAPGRRRGSRCRPGASASPGGRPACIRRSAPAAGVSSAVPRGGCSTPGGRGPRCSRPATVCDSCRWRPASGRCSTAGRRHECARS